MKVWITKYALTDGIIEAESDEKTQTKKKLFAFWNNDEFGGFYPQKEEVFFDKQSAIKKAEEMRQKKIESLKRQIKNLEEMRFK